MAAPTDTGDGFDALVGETVILDMQASYVVVGRLASRHGDWLEMTDADVHDLRDSTTTRELYVLEVARHGVRRNRTRVLVRADQIVCVARLDDFAEQ